MLWGSIVSPKAELSPLSTIQTDRIGSVQSSLAMKAPCRVATTADINAALSGGALGSGGAPIRPNSKNVTGP
jgi:hypothetical protein